MTREEFKNRTGVQVDDYEWYAINETYNYSKVDKDTFCKYWCKMNANRVSNARLVTNKNKSVDEVINKLNLIYMRYSSTCDNALGKLTPRYKEWLVDCGITVNLNWTLTTLKSMILIRIDEVKDKKVG